MSQIYAEKQPLMCYIGYYSEKRHASGKRAKAEVVWTGSCKCLGREFHVTGPPTESVNPQNAPINVAAVTSYP